MLILATCFVFAAALAPTDEDEWGQDPVAPAQSAPPAHSAPQTLTAPGPGFAAPAAPATAAATAAAKKAQPLKEKANLLYRAKRFEEAGRFYRQAADMDSADASVRNYIGLCFLKRGLKDSALAAEREALRLADRSLAGGDTSDWSFPDLRARKSAYFNLDKLGGPMPEPKPGQCETWSSFSECRARLHVCAETGWRSSQGGTLHWNILRVGLTRSRALFSYDEVEVPSQVPHPEMRDMEEISIEGVPESKLRWVNLDSSVT
ncbi:MAG: hypothetical protein JWO30_774, partial [Fibrobacteres bacterium]|nr:hypothetical protein [Fibrobacterota bacterium]